MKFLIPPRSSGYAIDFGLETVRIQLDGGAGRFRKDISNSSSMVTCQWMLDPTQYEYAMAFYRTQTSRGAIPFEIDLVIDDGEMTERVAYFVPETFKLSSVEGQIYFLAATLEVLPLENEDEATDDAAIIAAYNTSQGYTP